MTKTDWTPESQPVDEADPLSATGMFLSAFGKESDQSQKRSEESPVQSAARTVESWSPAPAPVESPKDGPGEFTKLFRASELPSAQPKPAVVQPPAAQPPASLDQRQAPAPAPGEFTRIFVKPADPLAAPVAKAPPEPAAAPHPAPAPSRMKGFSSGASDSASAEGGFTQFFAARPAAPPPAPAPRAQAYQPPTPIPAPPAEEVKPLRQPDFSFAESPVASGSAPSGVTDLFASLAPAGKRQEPVRKESFDPLPSFTPVAAPEPSAAESGSVTRLIQRLSEGARTPAAPEPPPAAAPFAAPPADSGPGEFTRMISASTIRAGAAAPPAAPQSAPPPAAAAPLAMPAIAPPPAMPPPKPPAAPPMPAFQAPKIEAPKPPAFAAPALPAPKSKLEEMVPILLIVNTFLLIVLIVVEVFALKAK